MSLEAANPWKVGLFVVIGIASTVGAIFWLAARRLNPEVIPAITYFNESVEGLDLGSPIKIRGVKVGVVSEIGIAPDHRMVEVHMRLFVGLLEGLGLWPAPELSAPGRLGPVDLRVQLTSSGITGVKFVEANFFDPRQYPYPELDFSPGRNYVPSVPSTLKSLGDALTSLVDALPGATKELAALAKTLEQSLQDAHVGELAARLERVLAQLEEKLAGVDSHAISTEIVNLAQELRSTTARVGEILEQADVAATSGALRDASTRAGEAASAVRGLSTDAGLVTRELEQDLASLRETLDSLRALAVLLERDPGALLRGRGPAEGHPLETDR